MNQTRLGSLIESLVNVVIGYGVALAGQLFLFPRFGIHIPLSSNLWIGAAFTLISVVRSYAIRRFFNSHIHRFSAAFARIIAERGEAIAEVIRVMLIIIMLALLLMWFIIGAKLWMYSR